MNPEKTIQTAILNYLHKLEKENYPIYIERRQAGGFSYKKGSADIYIVLNGQHIEIEVKAINGHLSPLQEKWKQKCESLNIKYYVVKSVEEVKDVIKLNYILK